MKNILLKPYFYTKIPQYVTINYSSFYSKLAQMKRVEVASPVLLQQAIILPVDFEMRLNDSKQLSEKVREQLKPILESEAVSFAVTHLYPAEIDEINI
jgi:ribonuclease HII